MTDNHETCNTLLVLQQEVKNINALINNHLLRFDKHMDNEEKSFDKIYEKLDAISTDVSNLKGNFILDSAQCRVKYEEAIDTKLEVYEKKLEAYVTKHEVRLVWATLTVVLGVFLWLFNNFSNIMKDDSTEKAINALIVQQKSILTELSDHSKLMQQLTVTQPKTIK